MRLSFSRGQKPACSRIITAVLCGVSQDVTDLGPGFLAQAAAGSIVYAAFLDDVLDACAVSLCNMADPVPTVSGRRACLLWQHTASIILTLGNDLLAGVLTSISERLTTMERLTTGEACIQDHEMSSKLPPLNNTERRDQSAQFVLTRSGPEQKLRVLIRRRQFKGNQKASRASRCLFQ